MPANDSDLVLSFLEECQDVGIDYALRRLRQRQQFLGISFVRLASEADRISSQIEKRYQFMQWGYLVPIGLGILSLPLYMYVVCSSRYPEALRLVFCLVAPANLVFIKMYVGYLRKVLKKRQTFRQEMAILLQAVAAEQADSPRQLGHGR